VLQSNTVVKVTKAFDQVQLHFCSCGRIRWNARTVTSRKNEGMHQWLCL